MSCDHACSVKRKRPNAKTSSTQASSTSMHLRIQQTFSFSQSTSTSTTTNKRRRIFISLRPHPPPWHQFRYDNETALLFSLCLRSRTPTNSRLRSSFRHVGQILRRQGQQGPQGHQEGTYALIYIVRKLTLHPVHNQLHATRKRQDLRPVGL
jgi:hypothetical protein